MKLLPNKATRPLVVAGIVGAVLMVLLADLGYLGAVFTGSMDFCISCHSMRTPYAEYKRTVHFNSKSGVQVACPDCHVPRQPLPYLWAKVMAAKDVWGEITGVIDTPEKFQARKLEMAQRVWARLEETDSRECRNCHVASAMKVDAQRQAAKNQHPKAFAKGETCIACHKAIAHSFPDMGPITDRVKADLDKTVGKVPAGSASLRTLEIKELFIAADGQTVAGRVLPGAEMHLLRVDGTMGQVAIKGWRQEGTDRVIYAAAGKRILMASLAPPGIEAVTTSGETVMIAETGQTWSPAAVEAWIPVADVTADGDRLWAYASTLYAVNCAICHAAPHVNEYTANEWIGQLRSMVEQSNLGREDRALVQTWLQLNGRDAAAGH